MGEVRGGEVEVDEEVVAEEGEGLAVGEELGDVAAHHRELRLGVAGRTPAPAVPGHALRGGEHDTLRCLAHAVGAAPDDEGQASRVPGRARKRAEPGFELREGAVARGVAVRSVRFLAELRHRGKLAGASAALPTTRARSF